MESEEFGDIVLREKERSLFISRVPKPTKDLFIELANSDFASDYGLLLHWLLSQAIEYQRLKEVLLDKDFWIKLNKKEEVPEDSIKLLSGKSIKKRMKGGIK